MQNELDSLKREYDAFKIEANKYKNNAENMIENLHAENSN